MLNKPMSPPFFIHAVSGWAFSQNFKNERNGKTIRVYQIY